MNQKMTRSAQITNEDVVYSQAYKRYVLILLMLVYACNFLDRQILGVLLQAIKLDLGLSDTQMGFLSGMGFALFYATLGIPLARWADIHKRVPLISVAIALWSAMTALSGVASNFLQLGLARIGVGVGEAGCTPPAHSLISDYFEPDTRVRAMAIYAMGAPIGIFLGYLLGGWINELYGWRMAFYSVGIPGLALALLVRFTIREPARGHSEKAAPVSIESHTVAEVVTYLWSQHSFRHLALGTAFLALAAYGGATWFPAFLIRSHGMSTGEIGTWLGIISGVGGISGTLLGGYLGERLGNRDKRWNAWIPAIALIISIPFTVGALTTNSGLWVLILVIPSVIAPALHAAPVYASIQGLAGLRMRAMAVAVLFFITNMIGLGLGPLVMGVSSDLLSARFGDESLRITLLLSLGFTLWGVVHYLIASKTIRADLARATGEHT